MADLYQTFQTSFAQAARRNRLDRAGPAIRITRRAEPEKIEALRALRDRLQALGTAIEAAVFELQNAGRVDLQLSHALSIANHCTAGAAQLLVAALDGSEDIRAAVHDMEASSDALDEIKTSTQDLVDDVDNVTGVLTTAGKVLELIRS